MKWLLWQQLVCLPRSAMVGAGLGVLLDWSSGYWRGKTYRRALFVSDVLLCMVAAIVTFFSALVIADGQLHPAIFAGLLLGALAEHVVFGRRLSALACRFHAIMRACSAGMRRFLRLAAQIGRRYCSVNGNFKRRKSNDGLEIEKN